MKALSRSHHNPQQYGHAINSCIIGPAATMNMAITQSTLSFNGQNGLNLADTNVVAISDCGYHGTPPNPASNARGIRVALHDL